MFVFRRLREDYHILDLTDGGHFDNLGLYELIRRKLELIVVCDGSSDRSNQFTSLATAIERVKVDLRAFIEFVDPEYALSHVSCNRRGRENGEDGGRGTRGRGFAVAKVAYECGKEGRLIYIKPTVTEGVDAEISSYARRNRAFPHESTGDQFFDEIQFEAYRELGYALGCKALPSIGKGRFGEGDRWQV